LHDIAIIATNWLKLI